MTDDNVCLPKHNKVETQGTLKTLSGHWLNKISISTKATYTPFCRQLFVKSLLLVSFCILCFLFWSFLRLFWFLIFYRTFMGFIYISCLNRQWSFWGRWRFIFRCIRIWTIIILINDNDFNTGCIQFIIRNLNDT